MDVTCWVGDHLETRPGTGFCSWGSGKGRPFPRVNHGDAPQNNIAEEQRYLFSVRSDIWRSRHSASSGHHRLGKTTHREVLVPGQQPPVYVRGGQVPDWEESQVLAALAASESSAALR